MKRWRQIMTMCLLLVSYKTVVGAEVYHILRGSVVGVIDGDTVKVLDSTRTQHRIRLQGIDAPESKQAYGQRSKQALSKKIFGKTVSVKWKERDRYGRIIGDIYLDNRWINLELVQEGWAWHYKRYSNDKRLAEAEVKARQAQRGLWQDAHPISPWDFRKLKRARNF